METAIGIGAILSALGLGFFGSPHCLGMCGGIVMAFGLSMQNASPTKKRLLIATYHLGRLTSYASLGAIGAIIGAGTLAPLMTNNALPRLFLGGALIFCALLMLGLPMLKNIEKLGLGLWQKLAPLRAKLFPLDSLPKALAAGLLWGLLPCGLVYGAILVAVGLGATGVTGIGLGAVFMFLFGLGTLPLLLATQGTVSVLQKFTQKLSFRRAGGVLVLISGLLVGMHPLLHANHHNHAHHHHSDHNPTHHNHSHHDHSNHPNPNANQSHHDHSHHNHSHHSHHSH